MHHTAATGERYQKLAEENGTSYDEEIFEFAKKWRIPARKFGTSQDFGDF
ncbi:MAG: short-chain dehydrogenase, partial [Alphaproteobacteria bacterium]|nr:short-chain dehydrogenase [Alphaproteobacteria bacterium]